LKQLEVARQISSEQFAYRGSVGYSYRLLERLADLPFSAEQMVVIDHVADLVRKTSMADLLEDIVYQTAPMVDALDHQSPLGSPLRMELVDNKGRIPGLELERVLRSIDNLDKGKGRPLEQFLATLPE
jgi:hypothetical protein